MDPYVLAGQVVGGAIAIFLVSWLIEWALLSRLLDDPVQGKFGSVAAAFAIAVILYILNGRPVFIALLAYGVPALLIGAWKYRAGARARKRDVEGLEDTFR